MGSVQRVAGKAEATKALNIEGEVILNDLPSYTIGRLITDLLNEKFGDGQGTQNGPVPLRFVFCVGRPGTESDGHAFILCTRNWDSLPTERPKE